MPSLPPGAADAAALAQGIGALVARMFLHGLQQLQGGGLQCLKIARLAQQMAQHLCLVLMAVGEHALAHIEQVHACAGKIQRGSGAGRAGFLRSGRCHGGGLGR